MLCSRPLVAGQISSTYPCRLVITNGSLVRIGSGNPFKCQYFDIGILVSFAQEKGWSWSWGLFSENIEALKIHMEFVNWMISKRNLFFTRSLCSGSILALRKIHEFAVKSSVSLTQQLSGEEWFTTLTIRGKKDLSKWEKCNLPTKSTKDIVCVMVQTFSQEQNQWMFNNALQSVY